MCAKDTTQSYSDTLFLPKTDFPMRPGFATRDAELVSSLGQDNGYTPPKTPTFVLHDGPPYANGNLHPGHVLNKVLKDLTCRSQTSLGHEAAFTPGWDCHGLPVEWNVEKEWAARKKDKSDTLAFRKACRAYAQDWVNTQREQFKSLGVAAHWSKPYLTMNHDFEAQVARNLFTLVEKELVYQARRPMMWSGVEHTVLAEAEVEYHDLKSPAAWVAYPVAQGPLPETASLLAWTTTPWTLTVSKALAYGTLDYGLYRVTQAAGWAPENRLLVLAKACVPQAEKALRCRLEWLSAVSQDDLAQTRVHHPLGTHEHWHTTLPCLEAAYVREGDGSGLVHTAPAHGPDDFNLGKAHGLEMDDALTQEATLKPMPLFGGLPVFENGQSGAANTAVLETLKSYGTLMGQQTYKHSYPHSWRSRMPVVHKLTPQWFLSMDTVYEGASLRTRALKALEGVTFTPAASRNTLTTMVRTRPDWVLSRQRSWGVPLPLFTRKGTQPNDSDHLLWDQAVNARVLESFEERGSDAWFEADAKTRYLEGLHDPDAYTMVTDVLDVWFDSGSSHTAVLEGPADMYMEGTDQHRGWFQFSLLCGVALKDQAPFKAVTTHGFTLDGKGRKMSKSLGNTVDPQTLLKEYGVDGVRLWVAMSDTTQDLRLSPQSLNTARDMYRKMRNTLRFMLGNLQDGTLTPTKPQDLPDLEAWLLDQLHTTNEAVRAAYQKGQPHKAMTLTHGFCAETLSNLYCDMRKDALYCDAANSPTRQAALYALSVCLDVCLSWMAPVLVVMTQEVAQLTGAPTPKTLRNLQDFQNRDARETVSQALTWRDALNKQLEALDEKPKPGRAKVSLTGTALSSTLLNTVLQNPVQSTPHGDPSLRLVGHTSHACPRCWQGQDTPDLCTRCEHVTKN